ncbi:MAG TPA: hypothetical protein DCL72_10470 [Rhizobiales bacterium]|jgi:hypothetical protein|nr:hypothetical protein [Hyphomicrobiales bacterium]HAN62682.1 hypothetical protein [Hyphomicrobiales bacterium]HBH40660.1 hypothetical protein [Hyphomicrobiales bacterium]HCL62720.1 hypothetical protein [Hyphomicrobiales bacterium]
MRSKLTLLTTAAALAFGLSATAALAEDAPGAKGDAPGAHSDITIVGTDTGDAPSGAEQGTEAPGAADQGSADVPDDAGAGGAAIPSSPEASDQGSAGTTGKSTEDLGASPAKPPVKEGKLPSPSSSY